MLAGTALCALVSACGGGTDATEPTRPTAVEVVAGHTQTGTAGDAVANAPSFVVRDQHGAPMGGVPFTVTVEAGGGTVTNTPAVTSAAGATSVGTWTLGTTAGENRIAIRVGGMPPAIATVTSSPGAAAKFAETTPTSIAGVVGEIVAPAPAVTVTDAHGNRIAGATVAISVTGGGSAPATVVTSSDGRAEVVWTLGTVKGTNTLTFTAGAATVVFSAAANAGDPAALTLVSGAGQTASAGAELGGDISVRLADKHGNGVEGRSVSFAVAAGGGSLDRSTSETNAEGVALAPKWRLGKRAVAQTMRATHGSLSATIESSVRTAYAIEVRYFGAGVPAQYRDVFASAAARITAALTGDVQSVSVNGFPVAFYCGADGAPSITEVIDDVVIYAAVSDIDGPGKTLAQAGPCAFRAQRPYYPAIGVLEIDAADLAAQHAAGNLEELIMHEMLHVIGIGTLWPNLDLLENANSPSVAYTGVESRQGCVSSGGSGVCVANVPVENSGGPGTFARHWRESVFGAELMTGYANAGAQPLSAITIGGLADIGYGVNVHAADSYSVEVGASRNRVPAPGGGSEPGWERRAPITPVMISRDGRVTR